MNPQEFLNRFRHLSFTLPTIDPATGDGSLLPSRKTINIPEALGNYINDLRSGQFNHTQYQDRPYMGSIPEVKERTEMIKRNPFQFLDKLLNEDTNYKNLPNTIADSYGYKWKPLDN